jgi:hypothetical protein
LISRALAAPAQAQLPPLVYVCPMPADASVIEDTPGKCPVCGMTLTPVRLDSKWWCPTHQTVVVRDGPGKCPLDGKALVQVTLAEHWICGDAPGQPLQTPGTCADGQARKIVYEPRAHGDHNPRHDGQFFMATDAWHHLEGTYPKPGLFRAYFYDNFTKPIAPGAFSGSLLVLDKTDKELGTFPLKPGAGGTLEASIPAPLSALPLKAAAKVRFGATIPEQRFDFFFSEYSKDSAPPTLGPSQTTNAAPSAAVAAKPRVSAPRAAAASAARAVPAGRAPAPVGNAPRAEAPPARTASPAPALPSGSTAPLVLDSPLNVPPALADALDESKLPTDTPGLLTELSSRAKQVESLIHEGNLAQVWLPATSTKTAALVLDAKANSLTPAGRSLVDSAVRRIVVAAWALDNYGDLGSREKISEAYANLAGAITDLKAAYSKP